ncbi:hypothetical protein FE840_015240 [Peteryoungia desertarenae]|uniref:Uncharacterized protein n=1 Tax=Peteryoungia desertarenae TaxID=1813451 RepID=A0ABX6QRG8_9HYPH|nr:hypothetical protein [Peteryoungia desertarenae]QLF70785.1 hypothetical protein FE840_015240 [Peteryoungia desertarenae]
MKYIVEMQQQGQADRLKGYTIGIDVFGRDEGFDPTTDPLVRVQAGKLRRLLANFYAHEGQTEPLRIQIPVGAYVPLYEPVGVSSLNGASTPAQSNTLEDSRLGTATVRREDVGDGQDLPTVFYRVVGDSDWRAQAYAKAVSLWSHRLWGVQLRTLDEIAVDGRALDPIYFVLDIDTQGEWSELRSTLRHVVSGDVVTTQSSTTDLSSETLQIGSLANQFVGCSLTIPGHLYRFCQERNLSSPLMVCLEATYRFSIEASQKNYREAKLHQNRYGGAQRRHGLVLTIPDIVALARSRRSEIL